MKGATRESTPFFYVRREGFRTAGAGRIAEKGQKNHGGRAFPGEKF
jgi:hypothetical protein